MADIDGLNPTNHALNLIHSGLTTLATHIPRLAGERVTVTLPDDWHAFPGLTFTGIVEKVNRKPADVTGKSLSIRPDEGQDIPGRFVGVSPLDVRVLSD